MSGVKRFLLVGDDYAASRLGGVILDSGEGEIAAVFTDTAHDGLLADFARRNGVEVHPSSSLREIAIGERLDALRANWLINVLSGVILPARVLDRFPRRALNLHTGPLPEYAGIHVHQWGIRNGETTFAVTVHHMEAGVDTGPIVAARSFAITPTDTGLSLFRKVVREGSGLFAEILEDILAGRELPAAPQDLGKRRYYRHRDALDGRVDWRWNARQVVDFVRAGNYWPFASPTYTAFLEPAVGEPVELLRAREAGPAGRGPGEVIALGDEGPRVACGEGSVVLTEAVRGKARLGPADWRAYLARLPDGRFEGRSDAA